MHRPPGCHRVASWHVASLVPCGELLCSRSCTSWQVDKWLVTSCSECGYGGVWLLVSVAAWALGIAHVVTGCLSPCLRYVRQGVPACLSCLSCVACAPVVHLWGISPAIEKIG